MSDQQPSPTNVVRADDSDERRRTLGLCLVLAAITFVVFGQTLRHGFVNYDDNEYVYENPPVIHGLTPRGVAWAFSFHASNWHPLTWLSHMLDCQLYGMNPAGHHLTNVLLHTATVIVFFLVLREMTGAFWRSAFVAAVFAVHPLRVESVAWVAERKDVLSGLFFMLTIGAYVRYVRGPRSWGRYGLVMFLFALGLMSKPMLVTLPLVLLLLDYWPLQRAEAAGKLVLEKLPLLALSGVCCVATLLAQNKAIQSVGAYSLSNRLGNAVVTGVVYLGQMVWPAGLAVFYPFPHTGVLLWQVALAGALLVGFSAVAWRQRGEQPWLWMGWLWYLVVLLPVVGIIHVGEQAYADRYTYLPQIGIYIAVTWLAASWVGERLAAGLMAGVLAVLMFCAWRQTSYWQNSETLWTHTLACTKDNYVAHINFGKALAQKGKVDDAILEYQEVLKIEPRYADAHYDLGNALCKKGKIDEGIDQYQQALQINPNSVKTRLNLGNVLCATGKIDEAIAQYQQALQINPAFAEVHNSLGRALCIKGRTDEGIAQFEQALQIHPGYAEAHNNLGNALLQKGEVDEAIACYQKALAINPGFALARTNLQNAVLQKQKP